MGSAGIPHRVMRTYRDNYPTGRKHCSDCKHWRMLSDFGVRQWADEPHCTVPRTLSSICNPCSAARQRRKTGCKRREWYVNGVPGGAKNRAHVLAMNRASARERRRDPKYRAKEREYQRIWLNGRNGTKSKGYNTGNLGPKTLLPREPFDEWLARNPWPAKTLARLSDVDEHAIKRNGSRLISITTVDAVFTALGIPDQVAVLWPIS